MHLHSKTKSEYISILILCIFLIFLPFKTAVQGLFIFFSSQLILTPKNFSQQIDNLKKENLSLKFQIEKLGQAEDENKKLKKILNFKKEKKIDLEQAEAISFSPSSWQRHVTVNSGKNRGIKKGQFAVDENGNLLGKVIEVKENSSRILLVNSPNFSMPVFIGVEASGLLKGNLTGARILYIENSDKVKKEDKVWIKIQPSISSIEIGEIKSVRQNDNNLFLEVDVKLLVKNTFFSKLFIIK